MEESTSSRRMTLCSLSFLLLNTTSHFIPGCFSISSNMVSLIHSLSFTLNVGIRIDEEESAISFISPISPGSLLRAERIVSSFTPRSRRTLFAMAQVDGWRGIGEEEGGASASTFLTLEEYFW